MTPDQGTAPAAYPDFTCVAATYAELAAVLAGFAFIGVMSLADLATNGPQRQDLISWALTGLLVVNSAVAAASSTKLAPRWLARAREFFTKDPDMFARWLSRMNVFASVAAILAIRVGLLWLRPDDGWNPDALTLATVLFAVFAGGVTWSAMALDATPHFESSSPIGVSSPGPAEEELHSHRHDLESVNVHLTEYQQLLEESRLHQTIASTIVSLEIGALGVGLPLSVNSSYALLGLAVVSSLLWFRYMDHLVGIFHVAEYVAKNLRPKLEALVNEQVLGWEAYLRRRRAGDVSVSTLPATAVSHPRVVLHGDPLRRRTSRSGGGVPRCDRF